ncbi:MAG: hypothetical protein V4443_11360 [Pseudomonadota bacterium]
MSSNLRKITELGVGMTALAVLTLAACSGGNGNSSTLSGSFVDAPTKGLNFVASPSGLNGVTDENGTYNFRAGDTVTFSLGNLTLGSVEPTAPSAGGRTQTFVLELDNGLQVAELLQTVNHGSASAMDVSGISFPQSQRRRLQNFLTSGGLDLGGSSFDAALLTAARAAVGSPAHSRWFNSYGELGSTAALDTTVINNLMNGLNALNSASGVAASGVAAGSIAFVNNLPGKSVYRQSVTAGLGFSQAIESFPSSGGATAYQVSSNGVCPMTFSASSAVAYSFTLDYDAASSVTGCTIPAGETQSDVFTVIYADVNKALATDVSSMATSGVPGTAVGVDVFTVLQTVVPSDLAGKTLSFFDRNGNCAAGVRTRVSFDATGTSFTANCADTTAPATITGSVVAAAQFPGVLVLSDTATNRFYYMGLPAGSRLLTTGQGRLVVVSYTNNPAGTLTGRSGILGATLQ